MGVFSKCCAKTHLPILSSVAWKRDVPRLTRVVVLLPRDKSFTAEYDGYGLHLDDDFDDAKFVLADVYQGERYEDLPQSCHEPNQGFFHDKAFLLAIAALPNGFPTYDDYEDALRAFEEDSEAGIEGAMAKLDIPPPANLYLPVQEYLNYIIAGMGESARSYANRHPEVLDWLPSDSPSLEAQARVLNQALEENSRARAEKALTAYQTKPQG